jgi:MFS family permease
MSNAKSRLIEWSLIGSQFGPPFMFSGVAVALPSLDADLHAGATALGLVETLFLAGSLASLLPMGRMADFVDRRALYKAGMLTFVALSALIGLVSSPWLILLLRFAQGAASATLATAGPAILAEIVPQERRGRAFGASIGVIYAGLTLGPMAAGALVELWGWRSVFLGGAALVLLGFAPLTAWLPARWARPTGKLPAASVGLLVSAVLALVGGSATVRHGLPGATLLVVGVVLAAAFVRLELRSPSPLIDLRALSRNRVLARALWVQTLLYMNAFCSVFMWSIYLQVVLLLPSESSGGVLATGSALMAIVAPLAGRLTDRFPPAWVSTIGVASVCVSSFFALTVSPTFAAAHVAVVLGIQGLGFALFSTPNMTIIMSAGGPQATNMASALAAKSRSVGMVSGMIVTGILVSVAIGDAAVAQHPTEFVGVMRGAFAVLSATSALALAISLRALRTHRGQSQRGAP